MTTDTPNTKDIYFIPLSGPKEQMVTLMKAIDGLTDALPREEKAACEASKAIVGFQERREQHDEIARAAILLGVEKISRFGGISLGGSIEIKPDHIIVTPHPHLPPAHLERIHTAFDRGNLSQFKQTVSVYDVTPDRTVNTVGALIEGLRARGAAGFVSAV